MLVVEVRNKFYIIYPLKFRKYKRFRDPFHFAMNEPHRANYAKLNGPEFLSGTKSSALGEVYVRDFYLSFNNPT